MSFADIGQLRSEIARVDKQLVDLLAKRFDLAAQVGLEKKLLGRALRDAKVEEVVRGRLLAECAARGISESLSESLASLLIEESVRREVKVEASPPTGQRVLIVGGAGRMGRSMGRYFRTRGYEVIVNDPAGPVDGVPSEPDLVRGVDEAEIVVVSVPMSVAAKVLRDIEAMRPKGLVFDVCSLKALVAKPLRSMADAGIRVTSIHPMFGPTWWPVSNGTITFSDCGNGAAVVQAKEIFRASGATLVDVSLDDHDAFMALSLGLSHLCLLTFARGVAQSSVDLAMLKRTGGTTFSRLSAAAAVLLADSPELLRDIQALNPHTPYINRLIREVLDEWQKAADAPDGEAFVRLLEQTHRSLEEETT